ncbi:nickel and cobalt resistance protein CnrB [Flavobacteriaceae bacterium UJ101]|nr:nickel and cobalt resistance protein CnrB [Flavobacteriaceae bacterium UJ101]
MNKINIIIALLIFTVSCKKHEEGDGHQHESEHSHTETTITAEDHHDEEGIVNLTEKQVEVADFQYGTFEMKNLSNIVRVNGETNLPPQNRAVVTTLISGNIKQIFIEEGDLVKKGQTLAIVENPDFLALQREYYSAISASSYTKKEYKRQKKLYEEKITARKKYELAKANYDAEQANIAGLASQLRQLSISPSNVAKGKFTRTFPVVAPISGSIGHIDASIGSYADLSQELFTIVDNSKIHLDLNIYEKDLSKIKVGQKVSFTLTNQDHSIINGKIFAVSKTFEPDTKTVLAHATVDNSKNELVANMFVNAVIEIGKNQVKALPNEAIVKLKGKDYIFIKEDHEKEEVHDEVPFKMIEVSTGKSELGYTAVEPIDKIDSNAQIVTKNTYFLQSQAVINEGGDSHGH